MSQKRIKTQRTGNLLPRAAYTGSPQPRVPTAFRLSKISSLSHRDRHVWRKHARLHDPHTRCLMRCGCNLDLKRSSPSARQSWPQMAKGEAARTAVRRLCELVCFVHTVPCDIFVSSLIKKNTTVRWGLVRTVSRAESERCPRSTSLCSPNAGELGPWLRPRAIHRWTREKDHEQEYPDESAAEPALAIPREKTAEGERKSWCVRHTTSYRTSVDLLVAT